MDEKTLGFSTYQFVCFGKLIEKLQDVICDKNGDRFDQVLVIPIQAFYSWSRASISDQEIIGVLQKIANQGCCSCIYYDDEKQIEKVEVGWFERTVRNSTLRTRFIQSNSCFVSDEWFIEKVVVQEDE